MEPTPSRTGSKVVAGAAVLAGLLGVAALVVGMIGLAERFTRSEPATTSAAAPATTAPAPGTTTVTSPAPPTSVPLSGVGFVTVSDDSGTLSASLPAEWAEVYGGVWVVEGEEVGRSLFASPDQEQWYEGWGTPGAFIGVATVGGDAYTPDLGDFSGVCEYGDVDSPEIGGYTTVIQEWVDCGPEDSTFHVALAWPESFEYTVLVQVIALDGSGRQVLDTILNTLSNRA